ncbi:hypothetical protein [Microbacterium sp. A93]|uniref:hypothetical protein n=1 Tax=Microbacterium sp. A93 TaxID=3450716 RepID=UPI003F43C6C1
MGAYGGSEPTYGVVISGNIFDGCHNHGVYSSFGVDAAAVTGNTFTRCSMPVAMTGSGHTITGNTTYTHTTGTNLDVAGLSIREPIGCTITGNTIRGDVLAGQVAVELGNYLAGSVEVSRNTITGNTIILTAGAGVAIRVGRAGQTTICNDNIVSNNVVRGLGQVNVGLVTVAPSAGTAYGNKVDNNTIVIRGNSHGIYLINANHTTVSGNTIRFEYNAAAATTVAGVRIYDSRGVTVRGNSFLTATGHGANLSVRAIWEAAGSTLGKYGPNAHDPLNATTYTPIVTVTVTGTNCFVDESGTGDPNGAFFASAGSRWARTDRTVGTSLYVKESGSTAASGWVGK